MRNIMKHLRMSIECIRYSINGVKVQVLIEDAEYDAKFVMATFKCLPFHQNLQDIQQVRIADNTTQCRIDRTSVGDDEGLMLIHPGTTPENLVSSLQTHIEPFFQPDFDSLLEILMDEDLGPLPEVQNIKGTWIDGLEVETTFLENLYEKYPNQECSLIRPEIYGELSVNSKIFQIDHLLIKQPGNHARMILENFTGTCLYFDDALIDENDLKVFMRKWISNTAYHNLQVLSVNPLEYWSNEQSILEGIPKKEWDETTRPTRYEYQSKVLDWVGPADPIYLRNAIRNAWELVRDTDGKVASVYTLPGSFVFCVWSEEQLNMTRMEQ
ncbi:hypothetical protein CAEBREN_24486 [Caenorhabditis brenneri]|uniref:F-box associated domain-containing protein n=1 Tax=Caenorhabditis brenneri TaxID=135651 RepID=G0MFK0_CAEBE|nr:hypothetical protein CAEBREN_24486 [Caenorhabditis brenneri]